MYSSGCTGIHSVYQAGWKLTEIHLCLLRLVLEAEISKKLLSYFGHYFFFSLVLSFVFSELWNQRFTFMRSSLRLLIEVGSIKAYSKRENRDRVRKSRGHIPGLSNSSLN